MWPHVRLNFVPQQSQVPGPRKPVAVAVATIVMPMALSGLAFPLSNNIYFCPLL